MKKRIFAILTAIAVLGIFSLQAQVKKKVSTKATVTKKDFVATQILDCRIGAPGPGGGTVFLENKNYKTDGWRYLEAYWADETIGVKYAEGTKLLANINAGKSEGLKGSKKSDWYIPDESELNSVVSELGYPNGTLPPGKYFVNGGKKFVSFDYDLKTNKRTLNKVPNRFELVKLKSPAKLTGKNASAQKLKLDKRTKLEEKRKTFNVGNIVVVRKITVAELSKGKPKFKYELGKRRSLQEIRQTAQQQPANDCVTDVTFIPGGSNSNTADYSAIDNYVLKLSIPDSMSIEDAAKRICQTAKSDIEKARAIYAWLGYNITYDHDSLNLSEAEQVEIGIRRAEETYERRKGVCAGYAALFARMAAAVGLQAEELGGASKNQNSKYTDEIGRWHSWNSVKIGNRTVFLDATWGASYSQNGADIPVLSDTWFDCDPELFVLTHLPYQTRVSSNNEVLIQKPEILVPEKQGISKPITPEIFRATPGGIQPILATAGASGTKTLEFFKQHPKAWGLYTYTNTGTAFKEGLRLNRFELTSELVVGQKVKFNFEVPQGTEIVAYFNGSEIATCESQKDAEFSFEETGTLKFYYFKGQTGQAILKYDVVASRQTPHEQAMKTAFANY